MSGRMRSLVLTATLVGIVSSAAGRDTAGIERFVADLPTAEDECAFLRQLCDGAAASLDREAGTPATADVLTSRQAGIAAARVRDATDAARAIERKRGRRLACFDEPACRRVLPRPPRSQTVPAR